MAKSREHVITNGRAAFYACMWDDLRNAAMDKGWALGLHGSLKSDMDIMAMPWTENAVSVKELLIALGDCFSENPFIDREEYLTPGIKPHGRRSYTFPIWADFYIDLNIIDNSTL